MGIAKEAWYKELVAREMSLPYDPSLEPGPDEEDIPADEDGQDE